MSDTLTKPKQRRPLQYNPDSEIVRAEHWPLVTGLSAPTIWRYRQAGAFVPVIELGEHARGARRRDLEEWLEERIEKRQRA